MSEPRRIQRKRVKGWKAPKGAVYVGRPTKWGNPFCKGTLLIRGPLENGDVQRLESNEDLVDVFRLKTLTNPDYRARAKRELRGKDLLCWCPLDQPCHADVLLELANAEHPK